MSAHYGSNLHSSILTPVFSHISFRNARRGLHAYSSPGGDGCLVELLPEPLGAYPPCGLGSPVGILDGLKVNPLGFVDLYLYLTARSAFSFDIIFLLYPL